MPTLNWLGKDKVVNFAAKVPVHALKRLYTHGNPSGNKIIHGDNLLALKSLIPLYEGKIKCVYIDPPYNTGNEGWVYNDNVNSPQIQKWLGQVVGKEGEDYSRHDKWLCMMYPRLKLLKQLLSDDGAIFISIDDNEQHNLREICDEIFGANNFVNMFVWKKNSSAKTERNKFTVNTEYVFMYKKSSEFIANDAFKPLADSTAAMYNKDDNDGRGRYATVSLQKPASPGPETTYDYVDNTGKIWKCPPKGWRMKFEKVKALENDGRLYFEGKSLRVKDYWNERVNTGKRIDTLWDDLPENTMASKEIKNIFGDSIFDTPKPTRLIERILQIATDKNSLVLDAFAGSGTTAHAVLKQNHEDDGNRKFILIEMEDYAETITAERVRRIGGSFDYYELGEPLFVEGDINPNIDIEDIRAYVWAMETSTPYEKPNVEDCAAFMGIHEGTAYYFYEGILDSDFLATMRTRADSYIIFAESCAIDAEFLRKYKIEFRKIPRDITKIWSEDSL